MVSHAETIDHQFYRQNLFKIVNRKFDFVSTIDHPFSSPPIRIIDGHQKILNETTSGHCPIICIWDVNYPSNVRYRLELSLDNGLFSSRDNNFAIFSDKYLYPMQKPKIVDFLEIKKRLTMILNNQKNRKESEINKKNIIILDNFEKIINIYKKNIEKSETGTKFYINTILSFYDLLKLDKLSNLFKENSYPYFGSPLMCEWTAFCIESSKDMPYDFYNLLNNNIFKKPYFRTLNINNKNITNENINKSDRQHIIESLRNANIIPSYEVFFWTLSLAGIEHFGNDYNFFKKLNNFYKEIKLRLDIWPSDLQISKYKQDSEDLIQFKHDSVFNCFIDKGNYIIKKNNNTKLSRINSISSIYIHIGETFSDILKKLLNNKITKPFILDN